MALLPEIIQSFLLGSSPSTSTLSSWPRSYTEVGRCELSTHLGGQQGRGSCKPTAVNSSVSSQAGRQPAWAFNGGQDRGGGGGGEEAPHQDSLLPKSLCRELDSAAGHLCLHRERRRLAAPRDSVSPSLPAPASSSEFLVLDVLTSATE